MAVADHAYVLETGAIALSGRAAELSRRSARHRNLSRQGQGLMPPRRLPPPQNMTMTDLLARPDRPGSLVLRARRASRSWACSLLHLLVPLLVGLLVYQLVVSITPFARALLQHQARPRWWWWWCSPRSGSSRVIAGAVFGADLLLQAATSRTCRKLLAKISEILDRVRDGIPAGHGRLPARRHRRDLQQKARSSGCAPTWPSCS